MAPKLDGPMAHGLWLMVPGLWLGGQGPQAMGNRPWGTGHRPWPMAHGPMAPWPIGPWPLAHGLPMAHGLWGMGHRPWARGHRPQAMGHHPWAMGHESQATGHRFMVLACSSLLVMGWGLQVCGNHNKSTLHGHVPSASVSMFLPTDFAPTVPSDSCKEVRPHET